MQISELRNLESNNINVENMNHVGKGHNKSKSVEELRTINVPNSTYRNPNLKMNNKESIIEDIANKDMSRFNLNSRAKTALAMSGNAYAKMEEEGINPKDLEEKEFVDIADKIRIAMAKGGADISMMGDISDEALDAISNDQAIIKNALEKMNSPCSDDIVDETVVAFRKAEEITKIFETNFVNIEEYSDNVFSDVKLPEEALKYMLLNELEPTIDNLYKAISGSNKSSKSDLLVIDGSMDNLNMQFEGIINEAGFEVNDETLCECKYMLANRINISSEQLIRFEELKNFDASNLSAKDVLNSVVDSLMEGNQPGEAFLITGHSSYEHAREIAVGISNATPKDLQNISLRNEELTIGNIVEETSKSSEINNEQMTNNYEKNNMSYSYNNLNEVSSTKQLAEVSLRMSVEANFALIKRGIQIDTLGLKDYIDELDKLEMQFTRAMLGQDASDNELQLFNNSIQKINELESVNAFALGKIGNVSTKTFNEFYKYSMLFSAKISLSDVSDFTAGIEEGEVNLTFSNKAKEAVNKYEITGTEVRKDLGDSIKKAFRNIDNILNNIDMELNDDNRRAVRILGYNNMEITKESVQEIKSNDLMVQRTLGNLKPGVVCEMIKSGLNPLDMTMEELDGKATEILATIEASSDEEKYSEFLYKLEQQNGISQEEREGFIGVYRLIHQVNKTDGAAIGMLLEQGSDITMRNLMSAIRSAKKENNEYVVDDSNGFLDHYDKDSLSITDQIEYAIQKVSMEQVEDKISPVKLKQFSDENEYMSLTPEQLNNRLTDIEKIESVVEEERELQAEINEIKRQEINDSIKADNKVIEYLKDNNLPINANTINAITAYLTDPNSMLKNIFGREARRQVGLDRNDSYAEEVGMEDGIIEENIDDTIDNIMRNLIHEYGEACKTPDDMAEAEQRLEELAENVMKNMLVEEDVSSIDIRGMHLINTQIHTLGEASKRSESYTIPIMVADEVGNLNLKIVRGKEEKGIVDIAFDMKKTGAVHGSFRYEAGEFKGQIEADNNTTKKLLEDNSKILLEGIKKETGIDAQIEFTWKKSVDTSNILTSLDADFEIENVKDNGAVSKEVNDSAMTKTLYGMARTFIEELGNLG